MPEATGDGSERRGYAVSVARVCGKAKKGRPAGRPSYGSAAFP